MVELLKAIKQKKPFTSEQEKVAVNLLYTHNYVQSRLNEFLSNYGITSSQYNILRILRGSDHPVSTSVLRDRMVEPMSDTSRLVERLVKKHLVSKKTCPSDMRKVDVMITAEGMGLLKIIEKPLQELLTSIIHLSQKESKMLNGLLDRMRID